MSGYEPETQERAPLAPEDLEAIGTLGDQLGIATEDSEQFTATVDEYGKAPQVPENQPSNESLARDMKEGLGLLPTNFQQQIDALDDTIGILVDEQAARIDALEARSKREVALREAVALHSRNTGVGIDGEVRRVVLDTADSFLGWLEK